MKTIYTAAQSSFLKISVTKSQVGRNTQTQQNKFSRSASRAAGRSYEIQAIAQMSTEVTMFFCAATTRTGERKRMWLVQQRACKADGKEARRQTTLRIALHNSSSLQKDNVMKLQELTETLINISTIYTENIMIHNHNFCSLSPRPIFLTLQAPQAAALEVWEGVTTGDSGQARSDFWPAVHVPRLP